MNEQDKIPLDKIANESPLCVCSQCGRKTWAREHLLGAAWKRCLMPLPKGGQCRGVWIPEDAAAERPNALPPAIEAQLGGLRDLICSMAGVGKIEDIDVNDLMSYSRLREEWDTATVTNHKLRQQIQRLLNQQAELIRPRLEQLKPDTELSDGHFVGCPPDCHCNEEEQSRGHRLDCPSNATRTQNEN